MADRWPRYRLRWLGTAAFELCLGPTSLLVDPFLSRAHGARAPLSLEAEDLYAEAILITHGHFDHVYDVPRLAQDIGAPVYASTSVCESLHDLGVPARQLHPLAGGRTCRIGDVSVRAVAARHVQFDLPLVWRTLRRTGRQTWHLLRMAGAYPCGDVLGYQFTTGEGTIVHFGSAGWYREELTRLHPDVALLPLQGHSHIHRITTRAIEWLRPRCVILHHHDDFYPPASERIDAGPLIALARERTPDVRIIDPHIGEWLSLDALVRAEG